MLLEGDDHVAQGFARRQFTVNFCTLLECGIANLRVFLGLSSVLDEYERVLAVPLHVESGHVSIEGPDEGPYLRKVNLPPSWYKLYSAQSVIDCTTETLDLFFDRQPNVLRNSEVIVADERITRTRDLIEDSECA